MIPAQYQAPKQYPCRDERFLRVLGLILKAVLLVVNDALINVYKLSTDGIMTNVQDVAPGVIKAIGAIRLRQAWMAVPPLSPLSASHDVLYQICQKAFQTLVEKNSGWVPPLRSVTLQPKQTQMPSSPPWLPQMK